MAQKAPSLLDGVRARLPDSCGRPVAVALSGGGDSAALLCILREIFPQESLFAFHVNHGVRSAQSCEEEKNFVEELCGKAGVPLRSVDLPEGIGASEDALRKSRYHALSVMGAETGCSWIALGHQRRDQLETVLMRLLRGSDLRGFLGMPERFVHEGRLFVRPLLPVAPFELEAWRAARGLPCFSDPSNDDCGYRRNFIRHRVLPLLDGTSPGWGERLLSVCGSVAELMEWKDGLYTAALDGARFTEAPGGDASFPRPLLKSLPRPLLRDWCYESLRRFAGGGDKIGRAHVESLADFAASERLGFHPLMFPGAVQVRARKRFLLFRRLGENPLP